MVKSPGPGPARYFVVIGLHPVYALGALGGIVAVGVATVWLDPAGLDSGLGMVLFAQMFLASSGFVGRARQGHFDPVLTGPRGRVTVVAAHFLVSIAPGVVAWLLVAAAGSLAGSELTPSAIAGGRAAALLIVSTLAWAIGFGLPRGAAGMLWVALLMVLVTQRADLLAAPAGTSPVATTVLHAATLIVCPFLLLGRHPPLAPGALAAALVLPVLILVWVCRRSRGLDIYLVDRA